MSRDRKTCSNCIHYEICSLWSTTDLDQDEAYKYCFDHYKSKLSEDSVVLTRKEYEKLNMKYISALEQLEKKDKETAEKILKWLKKSCTFFGFDFVEAYFKEQFGVEIKE